MTITVGLYRLGRDAELRHYPQNDPVVSMALAAEYGRKDQQTGKRPTQWVEAAYWGERAEKLSPHLLKGKQVMVTLEDIHIETYAKTDGGQGVKLVGRVLNVEFANGSGDGQQQAGQRQQNNQSQSSPPRQQQRQEAQPAPAPRPAPRPAPNFSDMDDDIPFISLVTQMSPHSPSKAFIRAKGGRGMEGADF